MLVKFNKRNIIIFSNKDKDDKEFEDVHKIFWGVICDILQLLVYARNIGAVSTYESDSYGY